MNIEPMKTSPANPLFFYKLASFREFYVCFCIHCSRIMVITWQFCIKWAVQTCKKKIKKRGKVSCLKMLLILLFLPQTLFPKIEKRSAHKLHKVPKMPTNLCSPLERAQRSLKALRTKQPKQRLSQIS